MQTISEQIADWLVAQGVEQVFSVTGGGAMFLNQALGSHPRLKCCFMHHEQACAMAAEGYARLTGKPAVVMLTTGPGAINALNGVFGAFTDSIPMMVISGQVKRETCVDFHELSELRQLGDQEGPIIAMAAQVCKFAQLIREPKALEVALPKAMQLAVSGRPGPVWLDIPLDIQAATDSLAIADFTVAPEPANPQLAEHCRTIIERLKRADRPLILAGTGVRLAAVEQRLLQLIESLDIPMATAWTHDLIASDHPLFAGRPGTIGTRAGNFCLQNADWVLVLGSRLNIRQTSYNFNTFAGQSWLAQVDVDAAELSKPTYQPDLAVAADLAAFLTEFEQQLAGQSLPDYGDWISWCQKVNRDYSVVAEHQQQEDAALNPYLVVNRIFNQLRADDIVVCGNASACILPFQVGRLQAGQRLFSNSGSASMGYDLPAALGSATAAPGRRVICFAGDGSLQMNIQELQTLKTLASNVIIIVLNNSGYLSIWQTHENFFGRVVGATPTTGIEFPEFSAVAKAYGLESTVICQQSELAELDTWLEKDGPLLIDIKVDPNQPFSPRMKSRIDENGAFLTPELDDMFPFLPQETLSAIRDSAKTIKSAPKA